MAEWTKDQIIARIRGEAEKQKVDPDLALAVAMQESELWPNAKGDNGKSLGLFQLQPAAAIDVGVNPQWRHEPGVNIYAGVKYLSQKLQQSKGNVEEALRRYNGGGDPNYVQNVLRFFKPGVAEAADRPATAGTYTDQDVQQALHALQGAQEPSAPQGGTYGEEDVHNALRALQGTPASAAQPSPPTATSTPEQDAAYRASRGQQGTPPVSPAPPTTTPPGGLQGPQMRLSLGDPAGVASAAEAAATIAQMRARQRPQTPALERFLALPSIQSLPPEEREAAQQEFQAMQTTQQEEVIKMEQPGYWQKPPGTDPAALLAVGGKPTQTREQEILAKARAAQLRGETQAGPLPPGLPTVEQETLEEGWTKPSTLIPLILGLGIPGLTIAAPGTAIAQGALSKALPKAGPLITRGARAIGEGLSQTAGWTTGRTVETGQVPSPADIGTEAVLNVGAGGLLEGLGGAGQAVLRRSQAGKAIVAADEATTAARATWQADTQAAEAAAKSEQKGLYDTAVIKAKASQRDYEMAVRARQLKIDAGRQDYDEAVRAQQADDLAKEQTRQQTIAQRQQEYQDAVRVQQADRLAKEQTRQQTIAGRQQEYQQAVTGQAQAITQARAVPGRYTPETPSWVQYEKFGDAAKDAVVDLTPAKAALAEVRASRGVLPDGTARPLPAAVESIAANLEKATGDTSFKTIREELRRLGPLTRSQDGNVRGAAKQLYGIYADVLEASPIANDLLKNANATFRKEMAVQDVAEWLTPGRGIVRIDNQGRETINVGALMTRLEKTVADDSLFRRSFAPDELAALRKDLRQLAGTPNMPRQLPREPAPVVPGTPPAPPLEPAPVVPGRLPAPPREPAPVALPGDVRVKQVPLPATADETIWPTLRAAPEPAPVTPSLALGERPKVLKGLTKIAARDYLSTLIGVPPGLVAGSRLLWRGGQQLRYGMARSLLSDSARPMMLRALGGGGTVSPRLYGTMVNVLSDAERQALLRDTREARERKR